MISPERLFYAAGALRRASVALQDLSDRFDAEAREASTLREAELAAKRAYSSPTLREVFPPNARILGVEDPADGTLTEAMMSEPCVGRSHPKDDGTRATDPADARAAECAYEAIRWHLASRYGIKIPEDADPVLIHAALDGIDKSRRPKPEEAKKLVDTRERSVPLRDGGHTDHRLRACEGGLVLEIPNASINLFEVLERFYPGCYAAALTCWERLRGESWTPTKMDPAAAPRAPLGK